MAENLVTPLPMRGELWTLQNELRELESLLGQWKSEEAELQLRLNTIRKSIEVEGPKADAIRARVSDLQSSIFGRVTPTIVSSISPAYLYSPAHN